jgi:pyruvate ferredoxin oxidoreductase gamma subunit
VLRIVVDLVDKSGRVLYNNSMLNKNTNKNRYEIIVHGRGGQGAKTTAEILAQAGLAADKFVQAFPEFGPERSGAPLRTFVRIADEFIRSHEPIVEPEAVLILDEGLLNTEKVDKNIHLAKVVIINTTKSVEKTTETLQKNEKFASKFSGEVVVVDASGISQEIIGQNRPNTVILGKFAAMNEMINIEDVVVAFEDKYIKKIGEEATAKNVEAIRHASEQF